MRPPNRRGTPVDPVPFFVVAALGLLACFSFGPGYLLSLGVDLPGALALSTVASVTTTAVAWHRFVWTARPDRREEIPPSLRVRRLLLGTLVIVGVFALLALLLLGP